MDKADCLARFRLSCAMKTTSSLGIWRVLNSAGILARLINPRVSQTAHSAYILAFLAFHLWSSQPSASVYGTTWTRLKHGISSCADEHLRAVLDQRSLSVLFAWEVEDLRRCQPYSLRWGDLADLHIASVLTHPVCMLVG